MKAKDIQKAGIPTGPLLKLALSLIGPAAQAGLKKKQITERLHNLVAAPDVFVDDPLSGPLAKAMNEESAVDSDSLWRTSARRAPKKAEVGPSLRRSGYGGHAISATRGDRESETAAPWRMWGCDIDRAAIGQCGMRVGCP